MQVVVGRVGRAHGVRGEVSIDLRTDEPARRFATGSSVFVEETGQSLTITSRRPHQGRMLVSFEQVAGRTQAEELRGSVLAVEVDPAEATGDPEEFYDHQLVGLEAHTDSGERIGTVTEVVHLPAQDSLAVRTDDGDEVLVPFVRELVPTVDVASGHVVVSDVRGLVDPDDAESAAPENG